MSPDQLISVDLKSDSYTDFTFYAWCELRDVAAPMEKEESWRHIAGVDWAANCNADFDVLAERLASPLSLADTCSLFTAALDATCELEYLMELPEIDIPSEDGTSDFLFHLVGLGYSFVSQLSIDPSAAIQIAAEGSYVESFKYVLEGTRKFFMLRDYVGAFQSFGLFSSPESRATVGTMRMVSDGLPGVVVRIDDTSFHAVTPIDFRDVAMP